MPKVNTLKSVIDIFFTAGSFETTKKIEIKDYEKIIDTSSGSSFQEVEKEVEVLVTTLRDWRFQSS